MTHLQCLCVKGIKSALGLCVKMVVRYHVEVLRILYADAWYHVMNRGRRTEAIFLGKKDYVTFIDLLKEAADLWNVQVPRI